jgi:uncharacterized membrane protein YeaQ/YmgE (transglycosylase-associated protein family)
MITPTAVLGWVAIGIAASLAAMIWPFRRGAAGVVWNVFLGVSGSLVGAIGSYLVTAKAGPDAPERLCFAAVGAIAALVLAHAAWSSWAEHARGTSHLHDGHTRRP